MNHNHRDDDAKDALRYAQIPDPAPGDPEVQEVDPVMHSLTDEQITALAVSVLERLNPFLGGSAPEPITPDDPLVIEHFARIPNHLVWATRSTPGADVAHGDLYAELGDGWVKWRKYRGEPLGARRFYITVPSIRDLPIPEEPGTRVKANGSTLTHAPYLTVGGEMAWRDTEAPSGYMNAFSGWKTSAIRNAAYEYGYEIWHPGAVRAE